MCPDRVVLINGVGVLRLSNCSCWKKPTFSFDYLVKTNRIVGKNQVKKKLLKSETVSSAS
jgi:hypothetical protein